LGFVSVGLLSEFNLVTVKAMLSVIRVHLPSEIPIVGCELTPYVLLRRPDKTPSTDDVPESAPLEGHFLKYRW